MSAIPENHVPIPETYKDLPLVRKYRYYNDIGEFIGYVAYYGKSSKSGKSGRVLFFEYELGEWKPSIDISIDKLPLFRLNKMKLRQKSMQVVIVENERSAMALSKLGVCAVSSAEGTDFVNKTDWSPLNEIGFVYLITSNDDIGIRFAEDIYMQLIHLPTPPQIKIVNLPNLVKNDDPLDWLQKSYPALWKGNEPVEKFNNSASFLKDGAMVNLLPNILYDLLDEAAVFSLEDEDINEQSEDSWSTPRGLKKEALPPVMAMTEKMLPSALRSYLINANPDAPLDYIAVSAIIIAGSLIGSGCGICPKSQDESWVESPILWAALVGEPGAKKTPSMDRPLLLVERLQAEHTKKFKNKAYGHEFNTIGHKARLDAIKKQIKELATELHDETTAERTLGLKRAFTKVSRSKPENLRRMFMTNETSVQYMTKLQAENPRGVLLNRDELSSLLAEWYGKNKADRSYYLSGWNRNVGYVDSKISRGITEAGIVLISLLGTIQPKILKPYVQKDAQGVNDGLMQRFQLAVYPDASNEDDSDDREQDKAEIERVYSIFETLSEMDFVECGAITNSHVKQPFFHFDEKAQMIFNDWNEANSSKFKIEPNKQISEHLKKYPKLFARFC